MKYTSLILILLTGSILGSSVVLTRFAVGEIPPLALVAIRLAVATIGFVFALIILRKSLPTLRRTWVDIAIVGVSQCIPLLLFTISLQFISSAVLTILLALMPLFTGVWAHFVLPQEKLNLTKSVGIGLGFAGVVFLIITRTTGIANADTLDLRGFLIAAGGVILAALGTVYARLRLRSTDVFITTAGQFGFGLLAVAPFAFAFSSLDPARVDLRGWLAVLYSGLIGSFSGFLLIFYLIKKYGATFSSLPTYISPVVSASLGAALLGEVITWPLVAGAVLVLLGVLIAGSR